MKILVAGHRGMVGRAIIRTAPDGAKIITTNQDLRDKREFQKVLKENAPDVIILAAAKVGGIGANSINQSGFLLENLEIQNTVISSAVENQIEKLVFLGSSCIYPRMASQPISETSLLTGPLEPTNEGYALAKISGIKLIEALYKEQGFQYFSLMPTNLYGPHDNFDLVTSHVPAALMRKFHEAKAGGLEFVTVWGSGRPKREFMHVDDMARACWHLLNQEVGGELINIGTGEDVSIEEFATLIASIIGYKGSIIYDKSKPDGTPRKLLDVSKAHSFGWKHQIPLQQGLDQTYAWFLDALTRKEVRGY